MVRYVSLTNFLVRGNLCLLVISLVLALGTALDIWVEVTSPTPLCTDFNITSLVIPMPSLIRDVLAHAQRSGKIEKHVVDLVLGI